MFYHIETTVWKRAVNFSQIAYDEDKANKI